MSNRATSHVAPSHSLTPTPREPGAHPQSERVGETDRSAYCTPPPDSVHPYTTVYCTLYSLHLHLRLHSDPSPDTPTPTPAPAPSLRLSSRLLLPSIASLLPTPRSLPARGCPRNKVPTFQSSKAPRLRRSKIPSLPTRSALRATSAAPSIQATACETDWAIQRPQVTAHFRRAPAFDGTHTHPTNGHRHPAHAVAHHKRPEVLVQPVHRLALVASPLCPCLLQQVCTMAAMPPSTLQR